MFDIVSFIILTVCLVASIMLNCYLLYKLYKSDFDNQLNYHTMRYYKALAEEWRKQFFKYMR